MLDISFYMKADPVIESIKYGKLTKKQEIYDALEEIRSN